MESITVRDMMTPIESYATVSEDATLTDAVLALEEAQKNFDQNRYRHRAILVYDKNKKIVGKLSQLDVLKALEPKYQGVVKLNELDQFGINADYIRNLIDELGLLKKPVQDICRIAAEIKVKNIMYTPTQGEYVSETAILNEAIVQLLVGHHQSLLVTRNKDIVGILRLTDIFKRITDMIRGCNV
ncbi:MAG: CBS domain-containing protein [Deltaproteobacteria bacterium]|nr:CBS domain-containing protein [Deltaproteobacteria bacterium]